MKKIAFLSCLGLMVMLLACNSKNPELENAEQVKDRSEQKVVTGGNPSDDLKANAIQEGDIAGRVKWSLGRIQEELRNSTGAIESLGEVSVLVDANFQW